MRCYFKMLDEYLIQTCELVAPTRNEYGDYISSSNTELACRFREINTVRRGSHEEYRDSDGMFWFKADSGVQKGNIILFEGTHYQVERITKARKLDDAEVHFIKAEVKITDIGIS